jgi:MFS family permease
VAQTIIDIGTVAFSQEHGAKALSGPILAILALSSAGTGLWYGARQWQSTPERRLVSALTLFAAGTLVFVAGWSTWFLFLAAFLLGLAVAPTMITGFSIVGRRVPEGQLTEGLAWLTSSMGIGISIGSAVAGAVVDTWGTRAAFIVAAGCAAVAILAGISTARRTPQVS